MAEKISTEDCVAALEAAWPADFPQDKKADWKRVSKSGKKGEPITRRFYHKSLPLKGTVIEEKGVIVSSIIGGVGPWDVDGDSDEDSRHNEAMSAIVNSREGFKFIEEHDVFKPSDFIFYVNFDEELDEDGPWFMLVPVTYWNKHKCGASVQLDYCIERHLPESSAGEVMEATFAIDGSRADMHSELLKRGFIQNLEFDALMKGAS